MSFIRTRIINGHAYRYLEERYREGGKVRSRSTYLGRFLAAIASPVPKELQGWAYIERQMEKYPGDIFPSNSRAPTAPVPVEKTTGETAPSSTDAESQASTSPQSPEAK